MSKAEEFSQHIINGFATKGDFITLGGAMLDGVPVGGNAQVNIALKTLNRHGLIAGATGTGKTKTIQVLTEQLSKNGIPVLMMDIKGDFSGIAMPGIEQPFITERHGKINLGYETKGFPVELMTISKQNGVRLRATVSEFGPVLFSRILDLNDTQGGVVAVIFKYCDDHHLPLLDLKDFKKVLHYITDEGKAEIEKEYGRISTASTGSILRKIIELEQQGAAMFFGELSFDIDDLMRIDQNGNGYVNIIRLTDIQDKPKLFSTFMLSLLAEIYSIMPEQGDAGRPELVIFIDEAHLIFDQASKALQDQIETIVKLIRSKGIGIYFITQNPQDIPAGVLSQLGLKIQHALRAFTANDRKAIKMTAENYPLSDYYKTDEVITQLGIGEAFVTALNEKGIPTPLVATMLRAPMSRMDVLTSQEIDTLISESKLAKKYNEVLDRESAFELLDKKITDAEEQAAKKAEEVAKQKEADRHAKQTPTRTTSTRRSTAQNPVVKVLTSATFIRGALGVLSKMFKK
jgi:DNA helicase HerA-like ATPase